jgi:phosphoadenosine phosphosulfate reductase
MEMPAGLLGRNDLREVELALQAAARSGGTALLRQAYAMLPGRLAVVSSFGAESAVLLALVAELDPALPVIFLETGMHFAETLDYRQRLTEALGLRQVQDVTPAAEALAAGDPAGALWQFDPDACCTLRKVTPLERALAPYSGWINGRKRYQAATRHALSYVERDGARVKINPLAEWDAGQIEAEMIRRHLPRHPLVAEGYPSIGCGPCTRRASPGADPRSGRWSGLAKTECGIHQS